MTTDTPKQKPIDDMQLPAGKTCGDCAGWRRCKAFIGSLKPTNTRCDWAPSAFVERAKTTGEHHG